MQLDDLVINFNETALTFVNVTLAFIMFGIALDLSIDKFKSVLSTPKKLIAGLISQLLLLPLLTFALVWLFKPEPSLALGMFLVAACPGGNISNFISSMAKANVALSISLTTITSIASILFTPLNFSFYGNSYGPTAKIMKTIDLNWLEVIQTISTIIIIPILLGLLLKAYRPDIAKAMAKPLERISMMCFLLIVLGALLSNLDNFVACIAAVFFLVMAHNTTALVTGYSMGAIFGLDKQDKKSLAIETGIQNSGLGLLIIFSFFGGMGGMAIVTAWWGIWHIISGFTLAYIWRRE